MISLTVRMAAMWCIAVVWHHWRILCLNPAFDRLKPSAVAFGSFLLVFFVSGIARHYETGPLALVVLGLVFHLFLVGVLFGNKPTLVIALVGTSSVVDMFAAGIGDGVPSWTYLVAEAALVAATVVRHANWRQTNNAVSH